MEVAVGFTLVLKQASADPVGPKLHRLQPRHDPPKLVGNV
jgi:hypothetical protein